MTKVTIPELAAWIKKCDKFAIVMHISPDGDAICSALLLNRTLALLGKRSEVVCQDGVPRVYSFLPDVGSIYKPDEVDFSPEYVVFVDVSSVDRAGSAWVLAESAKGTVTIDHHETNTGFSDLSLIDGKASATGELVALLMKELGIKLDIPMSVLLYAALSTDTGNFSYSNTTPLALRLTAECIEAGLNIDQINALLFHRRTLQRTLLFGCALSDIELFEDGKVAFASITQADFTKTRARHEDNEGIISFLTEIEGVSVSALFEERDGGTKVSLRSNGIINVGQIALMLSGGGHERASGVQMKLPLNDAKALILNTVSEALKGMD